MEKTDRPDDGARSSLLWPGARSQVSLALLAGGLSTRMGEDKAFVAFHDGTLLEWMRDRLAPLFAHSFIVAREPSRFHGLGLAVVNDALPESRFGGGRLHGGAGRPHRTGGVRGLRHAVRDARGWCALWSTARLDSTCSSPGTAAIWNPVRRLREGDARRLPAVHPGGRTPDLRHLRGPEHRLPGHGRRHVWAIPRGCS